jgi:hypothetical protein
MSICSIPINILAVTLVFEKLMERRNRLERLSKLNMLVGVFFSDIGFDLLRLIVAGDKNIQALKLDYNDLKGCNNKLKSYNHELDFDKLDFNEMKKLVIDNKEFLSSLISNENILEHETFSDLLMALMHLRDEIAFIKHRELTKEDCNHLKSDIIRVYKALTIQWTSYLAHLKQFYPYLYSGAVKFSPF